MVGMMDESATVGSAYVKKCIRDLQLSRLLRGLFCFNFPVVEDGVHVNVFHSHKLLGCEGEVVKIV